MASEKIVYITLQQHIPNAQPLNLRNVVTFLYELKQQDDGLRVLYYLDPSHVHAVMCLSLKDSVEDCLHDLLSWFATPHVGLYDPGYLPVTLLRLKALPYRL